MPHCRSAGAAIMAAIMYWAVVGMPMPRTKQASAVLIRVKKSVMSLTVVSPMKIGLRITAIPWAMLMTAAANLSPIPVSVVAPTIKSHAGAGGADGDGVLRPLLKAGEDVGQPHLALVVEKADEDDEHVGPEGGKGRFNIQIEQPRQQGRPRESQPKGQKLRGPVEVVEGHGGKAKPSHRRLQRLEGVHADEDREDGEHERKQERSRPLVDPARGGGEDDPPEGGQEGAAARHEEIDDDNQRPQEHPSVPENVPEVREHLPRETEEPVFFRLEMDHKSHGEKVKERRENCAQRYFHVGNPEELGHDEGRGPHDGRHELAARAGRRLDAGSKVGE